MKDGSAGKGKVQPGGKTPASGFLDTRTTEEYDIGVPKLHQPFVLVRFTRERQRRY